MPVTRNIAMNNTKTFPLKKLWYSEKTERCLYNYMRYMLSPTKKCIKCSDKPEVLFFPSNQIISL